MKFMDESGDDGKYVGSNSEFFTISIINSIKDVDYKVKIFYADEYTQNHQAIVG